MIKIPIPLHPYVACRTPRSSQSMTDTENGWMSAHMRRRDQAFCHKSGSTECGKLLRLKTESVERRSQLYQQNTQFPISTYIR